jgi:8-oxo-dGTP diphosphatase
MQKKTTLGVAGIIWNTEGQVLIAQRPAHKPMPLLWEFPGGKIEEGELPEAALARELEEELGILVDSRALEPFQFISFPYPDFHFIMLCYHVYAWEGEIQNKEGQGGIVWSYPHELEQYPMPEADVPLIQQLKLSGKEIYF